MREIPLSGPGGQGHVILVDDEDYELMSRFSWHAHIDDRGRIEARLNIAAHRLLVDYPLTDHINGNPLDNRRKNLREATWRQNKMNTRVRSDSKTGFKGVSSRRGGKGFVARIQGESGKRQYLGWFRSPEEAARAYDKAAKELFGEFAWLNFPDGR